MPRSAHKGPKLVGNYKHRVVVECLVDSTTAMLWGSVTLTALLSSTGRILMSASLVAFIMKVCGFLEFCVYSGRFVSRLILGGASKHSS